MSENKKPTSLLGMRQVGPIKPTNKNAIERADDSSNKDKMQSRKKVKSTSFDNQKKSIKMSEESYRELKIIKNMENMNFDYEVVQLLISTYYHQLSGPDKRTFEVLKDNLK